MVKFQHISILKSHRKLKSHHLISLRNCNKAWQKYDISVRYKTVIKTQILVQYTVYICSTTITRLFWSLFDEWLHAHLLHSTNSDGRFSHPPIQALGQMLMASSIKAVKELADNFTTGFFNPLPKALEHPLQLLWFGSTAPENTFNDFVSENSVLDKICLEQRCDNNRSKQVRPFRIKYCDNWFSLNCHLLTRKMFKKRVNNYI